MTTPNEMPDEIWVEPWDHSPALYSIVKESDADISYTRTSLLEQRAKLAAEKIQKEHSELNLNETQTNSLVFIILQTLKGTL